MIRPTRAMCEEAMALGRDTACTDKCNCVRVREASLVICCLLQQGELHRWCCSRASLCAPSRNQLARWLPPVHTRTTLACACDHEGCAPTKELVSSSVHSLMVSRVNCKGNCFRLKVHIEESNVAWRRDCWLTRCSRFWCCVGAATALCVQGGNG